MNYNQTVAAVARKLRQYTRREVRDVLDVLLEVWREELLRPGGSIHMDGLGKLSIEQQTMRVPGAIRRALVARQQPVPAMLTRYYVRFHLSRSFRQELLVAPEREHEEAP